ncbi:MAG TPA: YfhO family protein, partial [bacterium]|nr:YfhO family protein [bacterium]
YSGMPFLADVQSAVLYPLNLALTFFVDEGALSFAALQNQIIFHYFLAGAFMFALLRHFRLGRFSCLIGSVSFMFCGFLVAHLGHVGMSNVAVWIPLVFLFFHKSLTERHWLSAVWAGFFYGICIMGGHSQPALYMLATMSLYVLWSVLASIMEQRPNRLSHSFSQIGLFALMMLVTLGVAAAQIAPMAELALHSIRAEEGFDFATSYSLPPRQLITLLIPKFFGMTVPGERDYWGEDNFTEMCVYVGILPIVLAAIALLYRKDRMTRFFGLLALFSLLMALGKHTPLYRLLYALPTPLRLVRVPARFGYVLGFSTAILAGFGAETFLSELNESARISLRRILVATVVLMLMGSLLLAALYGSWIANSQAEDSWKYATAADQTLLFLLILFSCWMVLFMRTWKNMSPLASGISLLVVLVVDLLAFGAEYNLAKGTPEQVQYERNAAVDYLKAEIGTGRFEQTVGIPYNTATRHGIFDVEGWNPFSLNEYDVFRKGVKSPQKRGQPEDVERLRYVLGVNFVVGKHLQLARERRTVNAIEFDASTFESVGPAGEPSLLLDNLPVVLTDRIGLVSDLGYAVETPQGTLVGELEVETFSAKRWRFPIRAGIESSEWACDYRDNLPYMKHLPARVAWEHVRGDIPAKTFIAEFDLPELEYIRSLHIVPQDSKAVINVHSFSLIDSQSGQSVPIGAGGIRFDQTLNDIIILRTRSALPRALLVHEVEWAQSFEDSIEKVREQAYDLREKVILEGSSDQQEDVPLGAGVGELVQVSVYRPNEVVIRVEAHAAGVLVLNDVLYPGWRAYLDGKRVRLFRANGIMRAVAVPPGRHWIRMAYRPRLVKQAGRASLLTLLIVALLAFLPIFGWFQRTFLRCRPADSVSQVHSDSRCRRGIAVRFTTPPAIQY